jgi:uncharacterized protein (TIGR03435 family)
VRYTPDADHRPAWIYTESWDIVAQAEGIRGEILLAQWRVMLPELAREHFKLDLRVDKLSRLAPLVARKRPKLTSNAGAPFQFDRQFDLQLGPKLICKKVTMAQLLSWLKWFTGAGRTGVDKTGLSGAYDFTPSSGPLRGSEATPKVQATHSSPQVSRKALPSLPRFRSSLGFDSLPENCRCKS